MRIGLYISYILFIFHIIKYPLISQITYSNRHFDIALKCSLYHQLSLFPIIYISVYIHTCINDDIVHVALLNVDVYEAMCFVMQSIYLYLPYIVNVLMYLQSRYNHVLLYIHIYLYSSARHSSLYYPITRSTVPT